MLRSLCVLSLVSCGFGDEGTDDGTVGDTGPDAPEPVAIAGTYIDAFGTEHVITDTSWTQTSPYFSASWDIVAYDNDAMWIVAQNDVGNAYYPGDYSRFDWVRADGLYYCQTAFAAASQADAEATPRADAGDLAGGCGGFPWTDLTP